MTSVAEKIREKALAEKKAEDNARKQKIADIKACCDKIKTLAPRIQQIAEVADEFVVAQPKLFGKEYCYSSRNDEDILETDHIHHKVGAWFDRGSMTCRGIGIKNGGWNGEFDILCDTNGDVSYIYNKSEPDCVASYKCGKAYPLETLMVIRYTDYVNIILHDLQKILDKFDTYENKLNDTVLKYLNS